LEENESVSWFQHDGAMTHTANTTAILKEFFGWAWPFAIAISRPYLGRLISLGIFQRKSLFE
jgi:hypothetical protein